MNKPSIREIRPTSGPVGTVVTIHGTDFGTVPGDVLFNSVQAQMVEPGAVAKDEPTKVSAVKKKSDSDSVGKTPVKSAGSMPSDAPASATKKVAPAGAGTSAGETLEPGGVFPTDADKELFEGSWEDTVVTVQVPEGATPGDVVVVDATGQASNGSAFSVTFSA